MFRACRAFSQQAPAGGQSLQIESAPQLLRMLLKSIDVRVKSRHGRNYLRKRVLSEWRIGRDEPDPRKQRLLMERAGAVLTTLHVKETAPTMDTPVSYDFRRSRDTPERVSTSSKK